MTLEHTNKKLIELYGRSLDGRPKFRLVWSTSQFEKRYGEVEKFYGQIFLDKERGVFTVPKYSYCPDRYILEFLTNSLDPALESTINYEPLWVFQDKHGNFLEPLWIAIEKILYAVHNPVRKQPMTEKLAASMEEDKRAAEKKRTLDYLNAKGDSDLVHRLRLDTAILNAGVVPHHE